MIIFCLFCSLAKYILKAGKHIFSKIFKSFFFVHRTGVVTLNALKCSDHKDNSDFSNIVFLPFYVSIS